MCEKNRADQDRPQAATIEKATLGGEAGRRMPAREMLLRHAELLHARARLLQRLAEAIPQNFPADADEGLMLLVGSFAQKIYF